MLCMSKVVRAVGLAPLGNLVRFILMPGQRHDSVGVAPIIDGLHFGALLADKAFDIDSLRALLNDRGAIAVIPPKANRTQPIACDFEIYRWRHLVENFFCNIKAFGTKMGDRNILFSGPPGVGKTLGAGYLATTLNWPVYDGKAIMNAQQVSLVFNQLREMLNNNDKKIDNPLFDVYGSFMDYTLEFF